MTARVGDAVDGAGVREPGGLRDREGIHVSAQHDGRAGAVAQHSDDSGAADAGGDVETKRLERGHYRCGGALFAE